MSVKTKDNKLNNNLKNAIIIEQIQEDKEINQNNENNENKIKTINIYKIASLCIFLILIITLYKIFHIPIRSFLTLRKLDYNQYSFLISVPKDFTLSKKNSDDNTYFLYNEDKNLQITISKNEDILKLYKSFDLYFEATCFGKEYEKLKINNLEGFSILNNENNSQDIYLNYNEAIFELKIMYLDRFQNERDFSNLYHISDIYDIINSAKVKKRG